MGGLFRRPEVQGPTLPDEGTAPTLPPAFPLERVGRRVRTLGASGSDASEPMRTESPPHRRSIWSGSASSSTGGARTGCASMLVRHSRTGIDVERVLQRLSLVVAPRLGPGGCEPRMSAQVPHVERQPRPTCRQEAPRLQPDLKRAGRSPHPVPRGTPHRGSVRKAAPDLMPCTRARASVSAHHGSTWNTPQRGPLHGWVDLPLTW